MQNGGTNGSMRDKTLGSLKLKQVVQPQWVDLPVTERNCGSMGEAGMAGNNKKNVECMEAADKFSEKKKEEVGRV